MKLTVLYRLCNKDKPEGRPPWYTKERCYSNFLDVYRLYPYEKDFVLIVDGEIPSWLKDIPTFKLEGVGNGRSFWHAYNVALSSHHDDEWVYFCEDDYMHHSDALSHLHDCAIEISTDYITLYDHPDRYDKEMAAHNLTDGRNDIFLSRAHHWRTVPSTTMTFGARVGALRAGYDLFKEWTDRESTVSWELFPRLLGLMESGLRQTLLGAIPSLATHCEAKYLAPFYFS